MNNRIKIFLFLSLLLISGACENIFEYSPYAIDFSNENKNINQRNIDRLLSTKTDDTIKIALTADNHRWYDELGKFAKAVNKIPSVDFSIHGGDIADFGLPQQYIWSNSYLLNLNKPYFVVIGNHDLVGNGGDAYQEMFGKFDFSFIYSNTKFVFINTNSREFKFNGTVPDINWLDNQLKPDTNFNKAVVIFHVPPMDSDFDPLLERDFQQTLAKYDNVLLTIHGHLHHFEVYKPYADSITYLNTYGAQYNKYVILNIINDKYEIEEKDF
ncbi:MAG: metallophosphoesterase [Bacteroidota bacterium]|nr:metallophosphoesterase [Bacteroidota bacterium]